MANKYQLLIGVLLGSAAVLAVETCPPEDPNIKDEDKLKIYKFDSEI